VANAVGQASDPYVQLLGEQIARLEVQRDVIIAQNDPEGVESGSQQAKLKQINDRSPGYAKTCVNGRTK